MSKFEQKAQAQTRQIIGQMLGDELLVEEGKQQERQATEPERGRHDQSGHDQGMARDERGQEQLRDKERAQRVGQVNRGSEPPGRKS